MNLIGSVEKTKVDKESNNIVITTITDNTMSRDADLVCSANEDSVPISQVDTILLAKIEGINQLVAIGVVSQHIDAKEGEKIIYSRDANAEVIAKIHLKNNGEVYIETKDKINIKYDKEVILNDGKDYAVKFNELDKEMKTLKQQLNAFIKEYNNHVHVSPSGPTEAPKPPSTTQITLDIKNAKSETIKIP